MQIYRLSLALLACYLAGGAQSAIALEAAASSSISRGPLPTAITTTVPSAIAPTPSTSVANAYSQLQQIWDDCANIKSTCNELLDEGRFAPARKKWVDYYAGNLTATISDLNSLYDKSQLPADLQASVQQNWQSIGSSIDTLQKQMQQLQSVANNVKDPIDDKYPAAFWGPTRDLLKTANDLDKSLVGVLAQVDSNRVTVDGEGGKVKLKGGLSSRPWISSLDGVVKACQKISDSCMQMAGELERLNLSWGKAPTGPLTDEFYQGAFTKQEILSQYKYMPSFVFTTDPSVARFTYRMPPRRNMLAVYARDIGKLLNLMDSELLQIQSSMPGNQQPALAGPWQAIETKYIDARKQYLSLYNLIQPTTDAKLAENIRQDQETIGPPVLALRADMDQLRDAVNDFLAVAK